MFTRILMAVVVLSLAVGCAKKTAKNTGRADDTASPPPVEKPKAGNAADKKKDETPSWIKPRPQDGELPAVAPSTGKPPWVASPPPAGVIGQNPPPVQPGNPGGQPVPAVTPPVGPPPMGAIPPTTPATPTGPAGKVVTKDDLNEVFVFVHYASLASGEMPSPDLIRAALVKEKAAAADLVKGGYIILTGTTNRESIWAFERNVPSKGGWIAGHNGPEEVSAAEFARRIRQ